MRKKLTFAAASAAIAAALAVPPPAAAATTETCHPPRYDTVHCACEAMVRALSPVIPPESWNCD